MTPLLVRYTPWFPPSSPLNHRKLHGISRKKREKEGALSLRRLLLFVSVREKRSDRSPLLLSFLTPFFPSRMYGKTHLLLFMGEIWAQNFVVCEPCSLAAIPPNHPPFLFSFSTLFFFLHRFPVKKKKKQEQREIRADFSSLDICPPESCSEIKKTKNTFVVRKPGKTGVLFAGEISILMPRDLPLPFPLVLLLNHLFHLSFNSLPFPPFLSDS